jgi:uncharacterized membrane protein YgcG
MNTGLATVIALAVVLFVGIGGALLIYTAHTRQRKPFRAINAPALLTAPPSDLPPVLAGRLVDKKTQPRHLLAMLIDLARRDMLHIREEKSRRQKEISFHLVSQDMSAAQPFERQIVRELFGAAASQSLTGLRGRLSDRSRTRALNQLITDALTMQSLYDPQQERYWKAWRTRTGILIFAALAWLAAGAFFRSSLPQGMDGVIWVGGVVVLAGWWLIHRLLQRGANALTPLGIEQAALWQVFSSYLHNARQYIERLNANPDHFEQYLPYAVAFGADKTWIKAFSRVQDVPAPDWYYIPGITPYPYSYGGGGDMEGTSDAGFSLDSLSDSFSASLESISDSFADMLNDAGSAFDSAASDSGGFDGGDGGGGDGGGGDGGGGE